VSFWLVHYIYRSAPCHSAKYKYTEWRLAECHCLVLCDKCHSAECWRAKCGGVHVTTIKFNFDIPQNLRPPIETSASNMYSYISLCICLSICLFVYLSICQSVYLSI